MEEVWKAVPDYEGFYEVSTFGKVRSIDRTGYGKNGHKTTEFKGKELAQMTDEIGRKRVGLFKHGAAKRIRVHQLVMLTFVGPCPQGMECCHNDGNPSNNALENLRYDTRKANHRDKIKHGTRQNGEKNGNSILFSGQVKIIKQCLVDGASCASLARAYEVSESTIHAIKAGLTWTHI